MLVPRRTQLECSCFQTRFYGTGDARVLGFLCVLVFQNFLVVFPSSSKKDLTCLFGVCFWFIVLLDLDLEVSNVGYGCGWE